MSTLLATVFILTFSSPVMKLKLDHSALTEGSTTFRVIFLWVPSKFVASFSHRVMNLGKRRSLTTVIIDSKVTSLSTSSSLLYSQLCTSLKWKYQNCIVISFNIRQFVTMAVSKLHARKKRHNTETKGFNEIPVNNYNWIWKELHAASTC